MGVADSQVLHPWLETAGKGGCFTWQTSLFFPISFLINHRLQVEEDEQQ